MAPPLVLIVDDDAAARYGVRRALEGDGHRTREADSGERCLELVARERPALVLLDVTMPGMGGLRCLEELAAQPGHPLVVMLTAYGNERLAVECLRKGAYDYLPKPYEVDELRSVVARALERAALEEENRRLRAELESREESAPLGASPAMAEVERLLDRIAPADVTVLVTGESGTGKELVARELHRRGPRRSAPFVAVNCAALPEELVESELFGHEKGSFTGAVEARKGKFELADRGTLFLDEVGEMSPRTQTKLLRVLQERSFERVGSNRTLHVDVRLVAATNKDLRAEAERGRFREDLYYRLKVAELHLPPLRERREEIDVLATRFLHAALGRLGRTSPGFDAAALARLRDAPWPGNVRELKNAVEYAAVMCDGGPVTIAMLPAELARAADARAAGEAAARPDPLLELPYPEARRTALEDFERRYLEGRLRRAHGNVSEAARAMGLARQSLQAKIKELAIDPVRFRLRDAGPGD